MLEKNVRKRRTFARWLKDNRWSALILAVAAALFLTVGLLARAEPEETIQAEDYAEYEKGKVLDILSDTTERDPNSDNAYRGEQYLTVLVKTGQYKGEEMEVYNYVSPLYGARVNEGESVVLLISTYGSGEVRASVFEYDREPAFFLVVGLFLLVTVLVGGKTGAKSLLGLVLTIACIFWMLIPLLMKGAPLILTVFLVCSFVTIVCFVILDGVSRKSLCAMLGTILGMGIALLFGLIAQSVARVDGMRSSDVEPLLQLRQQGTPIGLRGLLVGGIVVSTMGAVMDVAMSISSALSEVHAVNPALNRRQLFRSGMNIGRDMVGTMTNTLILAFLGSSFTFIIYLYSLGLSFHQLLSSAYLALETISGIASSIGVILAVPITALVSSILLEKAKTAK